MAVQPATLSAPLAGFSVLWLHHVVREVAPRIGDRLKAEDPTGARSVAFARATVQLEQRLGVAAEEMGESRSAPDVRVTFLPPAGVRYEIHQAPRVVLITAPWTFAP